MVHAAPTVSVVVPVLDGLIHLGAALASVREQTLVDHEVVVVDAGSTDGSDLLVEEIARDDERVRLVRASRRLSAPEARTLGLEHSRADVVATLDQDDLMLPDRLRLQLEALRAEPDLLAVGGMLTKIDDDGVARAPLEDGRPTSPVMVRWALPYFAAALSSSLVHRRDVLVSLGGFDTAHPLADDYALLVRLLRLGDVRVLPDVVGRYRRHSRQTSTLRSRRQHAETMLLRASVVAERTGRRPPPDVMRDVCVRHGGSVSRPQEAEEVCVELYAAFHADVVPSTEEQRWIDADHSRRLARIREADVVTTS
jgi:glycosyltransferase involved in cell wall biosynthesis